MGAGLGQPSLTEPSVPFCRAVRDRRSRPVQTKLTVCERVNIAPMADGELRFEMDKLLAYDDVSLVAEVQRVAALIPDGPITVEAFSRYARVDASTIRRRLGGWRQALERADLEERYGGKIVSQKTLDQRGRSTTPADIVAELQRIADICGRRFITRQDLLKYGELVSERAVLNRFGSWKAALDAAGLELSKMGRRYHEDEYFENLLLVWTHHGRAPTYAEMDRLPSAISSGGYASRFGTWGRAKLAFVERVNADVALSEYEQKEPTIIRVPNAKPRLEDQRAIPVGLRYQVLRRDRFRCVTCGRSPAVDLACVLHVDHLIAFSRGGKTKFDNLRALCESCNIGKGDRDG